MEDLRWRISIQIDNSTNIKGCNMAYTVKRVVNKTDAELDVVDTAKKTIEPISPHSMKPLINENLLDLAFVSKTARPVYIRIKSIPGDGDIGDGDDPVEVEMGDSEEEIENL